MPPLLDAEVKPFEDAFLKGLCWSVFEIPPKSFDERRSMVTCALSEMKRSMFKNDRNQNESNSFRFLIFEHNLCLPSFTTADRL